MTEPFLQQASAEENNASALLIETRLLTKPKTEARLLTDLTEAQRQLALDRFRLLRPHLEEGRPLAQIATAQNVPLRTLQRWVAHYRQTGLTGLVRQARADKGCHRLLSPKERQLIEGLALQKPPLSAAAIHRRVCDLAGERATSSYALVRALVRALPPSLMTLAHQGSKAYQEQFDLVHRREAGGPNQVWQADHCLLDILLVREGCLPARPWLTVVLDDYSRAVAGYLVSFDAPCALNTALALHQAIWRKDDPRWHLCGIPDVLYTDKGSDFTSRHLEQVSADLKIQLIFSTPGMPRGRGRIERFFATVSQMLLCTLPGYAPAGSTIFGASPSYSPSLTLADLNRHFREFLLACYHLRKHGETRTPPQERWEAGGFLPRMPDTLERLDLLLLSVARARRVRPDGLRFQGLRYTDSTLAAYVGEDVILRYDPSDLAEVRVFYQDRFLCRAVCQEIAGQTVPLREIVQARDRRRRELRQVLTDRSQIVKTLLDVHEAQVHEIKVHEVGTGEVRVEAHKASNHTPEQKPVLKRYQNE